MNQLNFNNGRRCVTALTKKRIIALITTLSFVLLALPSLISLADALKKEQAYQFIVDGEKWFTVSEPDALENILNEYQKQFLDNIDTNAQVKDVTFLQNVEIVEVEVKPEEIDTLEVAKEKIYAIEEALVA